MPIRRQMRRSRPPAHNGRRPSAGRHQRFAGDVDAPTVDRFEVVEAAQESALARARRADDGDHFALADIQRNALEHFHCAKALVNV
jgi:hypothetical protein